MKNFTILLTLILFSTSCNWASDFPVVINNQSSYAIVIPAKNTPNEAKAAAALQKYINLSTGASLLIIKENTWSGNAAFYIGKTQKAKTFNLPAINGEGYYMASNDKDVVICGGSGKGVVYGTYAFIEKYLDGLKLADEIGKVKEQKQWELPANFSYSHTPTFLYRQTYYPQSNDPEYLDWHGLHKFEDLWGIWGHSYFKLVNPSIYFKSNPEYFAYENGKRKATQLCVSNDDVVRIAIKSLKEKITDNPDAIYWSISAEDDIGYCQCPTCKKIQTEEGTPTGPHLRFVNKIAAAFPDKLFTTLAYTYTMRAPAKTKPAPNVFVMLSTIDAYRNKPIETEPSAAAFRKALQSWEAITHNLMVWDYTTQFTNYLAPLPDILNLGANIKFYAAHHVKGVFSQGSGDGYGEMAEIKSYLTAKLLWNPELDAEKLLTEYCKNYYKGAGKYVEEYIRLIHEESRKTNRNIDIYGNPVNEYNSYLTPELMDRYSTLFDQAEGAVEEEPKLLDRIYRLRLSLDYVALQQSRFYGTGRHGYLVQNEEDLTYAIHPKIQKRVSKFISSAEKFKVTELSEGGFNPKQYQEEWQGIFDKGWTLNYAKEATVKLKYPFAPEYPARKEATLIDEVYGTKDYSYNWLCFYGNDMEVTIDMETTKEVTNITMNFLDDPRHWIFTPQNIEVTVSADGIKYTEAKLNTTYNYNATMEEHYDAAPVNFKFTVAPQRVRFVHVKAKNWPIVPDWRFRANRKTMIACDEILVN